MILKKENRPEAADYGRSNPRNQRRIEFCGATTSLRCSSVASGWRPYRNIRRQPSLSFHILTRERVLEPVALLRERLDIEIKLLIVKGRDRNLDETNESVVLVKCERDQRF